MPVISSVMMARAEALTLASGWSLGVTCIVMQGDVGVQPSQGRPEQHESAAHV